ncbi:unnamed protein product [Cyclocybe aegerita]|uniref:CUE domain-containing protein n=1 Tax=Cyclocybe aegerita TaxID=1973307 RepID=A0A8S0XPB7_CYCAE|nr:unnamed protein product [Cyclocybe aegerita]
MFPDYDDAILQSVLESVNWSEDRAIDALLLMSDPEYRSDAPPQQEVHVAPMTQTDLDEQFARQLVLEEQHQQQAAWIAANPNAPAPYRSHSRPQGWQPPQGQPQAQSAGGTGTGEFQEQFNKIAETGKKTFGNIFSKVKAKIQELERGGSSPTPGGQQAWAAGGTAPAQPQAYQQPAYHLRAGAVAPSPRCARPGRRAGLRSRRHTDAPAIYIPALVYLPTSLHHHRHDDDTTPAPARTSTLRHRARRRQARPPPKKTVSLLRPDGGADASSTTGTAAGDVSTIGGGSTAGTAPTTTPSAVAAGKKPVRQDTDDGLEYAESPFEESGSRK